MNSHLWRYPVIRPLTGLLLLALLLLFITGCGSADSPRQAVVALAEAAEETAVVEPTRTGEPIPTAAVDPQNVGTPAAEHPTPTITPLPPTPTRKAATLLSKLGSDQGNIPSLTAEGTLNPTFTPTPATPAPFQSGNVTLELIGTNFAAEVSNNPALDFVKIGFHTGPGGNLHGLSEWMEALDAAGIPFMLKSVDNAGPLLEAQRLREASGVPHILVYRRHGGEYELPDYTLNPIQAAREHWARHLAVFPPELDPSQVWIETINEVDKDRSGWLGLFALETARLAVQDGYKWAAFGWSAGEPEIDHWLQPSMVNFLRYAAAHPEQVAIALHEYSYMSTDLLREYPHLVGRFQQLFWVCDELGIERPTVLITEFGWEYREIPEPDKAMAHLQRASEIYSSYGEVKGAAIWYLGPGYGGIDSMTRQLIAPLTSFALTHYYQRAEKKEIDPRYFR